MGFLELPKTNGWTGVGVFRLIMNLIPLNNICQPLAGDVATLPSWSSMSPFFLQPTESLLVSSEDVRCFFYVMSVPTCWHKYLAFNKVVPEHSLPDHLKGREVYLAAKVLPMGFLNSVSLAQHVHRVLVPRSARVEPSGEHVNDPSQELRERQAVSGSSIHVESIFGQLWFVGESGGHGDGSKDRYRRSPNSGAPWTIWDMGSAAEHQEVSAAPAGGRSSGSYYKWSGRGSLSPGVQAPEVLSSRPETLFSGCGLSAPTSSSMWWPCVCLHVQAAVAGMPQCSVATDWGF